MDKRPALESDERMLAWAYIGSEPGGPVAVATTRGLWLPDRGRLGWHEIHKAAWSSSALQVTPAEVAEERTGYTVLVDGPVAAYQLQDPGELPDQVRTRVTRSVAYTTHHPLPVGGVRVVGRRVSGRDGLTWTVRYDTGTPVDIEQVATVTDELVASAREATAPAD